MYIEYLLYIYFIHKGRKLLKLLRVLQWKALEFETHHMDDYWKYLLKLFLRIFSGFIWLVV